METAIIIIGLAVILMGITTIRILRELRCLTKFVIDVVVKEKRFVVVDKGDNE